MVVGADVSYTWFVFFSDTISEWMILLPLLFLTCFSYIPLLLIGILLLCRPCIRNLFRCCYYACCCTLCYNEPNECAKNTVEVFISFLKGVINLPHVVVRAACVWMKPASGNTSKTPRTEFFGYIVPNFFLLQIFSGTLLLISYAVSAFISVFLVKESDECDSGNPELVCFDINATRLDCSIEESTVYNKAPDYCCFQFVFATSEALTTAGGILTVGVVSFTAVVALILFISKGKKSRGINGRCCCTICTQFSIFVFASFLFVILPLVDAINEAMADNRQIYLEMIPITQLVICSVCVPWYKFEEVPKGQTLRVQTQTSVNASHRIPRQHYPITLPAGPPDDERRILITAAPQANYSVRTEPP